MEAFRSYVTSVDWAPSLDCVVTLSGRAVRYALSPLQPFDESVRDDEIKVGDLAILAGEYLIVACMSDSIDGVNGVLDMVNYLRVTGVEEETSSRRRMNRPKPMDMMALSQFN